MVKSLTWRQVNAWRQAQHSLPRRLGPQSLVEVVARTGGIHAQVMSAAQMSLWARVDGLAPLDVQNALWQDRALVKTWAMRATLHLLPAGDLPLYAAARSWVKTRNWQKYFTFFGIPPAQAEAFLAIVPQILGSEPMTREQLAQAAAQAIGAPELSRRLQSSSWGSLWKPSAWQGDLCYGPNQGGRPTFVNPRRWLGQWKPLESFPAIQEIARRYLRAYGPAAPVDFAAWWGMGLTPARKLFQSLADELEPVELEGWPAVALRETLEPLQAQEPCGSVCLLPSFDAYVMGIGHNRPIEPILPEAYRKQVYRLQGWVSAVVLLDGVFKGLWELKSNGARALVKVRPFSSPTDALLNGIAVEAERLAGFLNKKIEVKIEDPFLGVRADIS